MACQLPPVKPPETTDHRVYLEPGCNAVGTSKDVVIEAVLLIPHAVRADLVHSAGDQCKLDHEIRGQILIRRVVRRQLDGNLEHILGIEGHPRRTSACSR
jgi:hypothetical protein